MAARKILMIVGDFAEDYGNLRDVHKNITYHL
jgi:hypothetical protein